MAHASRRTQAEINLAHLRQNFLHLKAKAGAKTWMCPMVKADAYGHGAVEVAKVLSAAGAHALGVALVEEGLCLRRAGIEIPILVFGFFSAATAQTCVEARLTPVLSHEEDLAHFARATKSPFALHLKFNTGMNRLGFEVEEAVRIARLLSRHSYLRVQGLCSHLIQGEDWRVPQGRSRLQAEQLNAALQAFTGVEVVHLHNSAAILSGQDLKGLGARPGIAIYGAGAGQDLEPVMSLQSEVALLHRVQKGATVSYDGRWQAPEESLIGVIPIGYADGVRRALSNQGAVLVRGRKVPIRGTVCMDYMMCDLSRVASDPPIGIGEPVTLWGRQGPASLLADEVASQAQTIAYELFTGVSSRVPRKYVDGAKSWFNNG